MDTIVTIKSRGKEYPITAEDRFMDNGACVQLLGRKGSYCPISRSYALPELSKATVKILSRFPQVDHPHKYGSWVRVFSILPTGAHRPRNPESMKPETTDEAALPLPPIVRPDCDNCGFPATYSGYHDEAGRVYVCDECMASHRQEHSSVYIIWPTDDRNPGQDAPGKLNLGTPDDFAKRMARRAMPE